jgi:ABC-type lipoprotein export system ATPase subunit
MQEVTFPSESQVLASGLARFLEEILPKGKTIESFYFNRNFIILDESLNALQESLQEKIIFELKKNENDLTIILVSHNKKNLEHCDHIFELNNGNLSKK